MWGWGSECTQKQTDRGWGRAGGERERKRARNHKERGDTHSLRAEEQGDRWTHRERATERIKEGDPRHRDTSTNILTKSHTQAHRHTLRPRSWGVLRG